MRTWLWLILVAGILARPAVAETNATENATWQRHVIETYRSIQEQQQAIEHAVEQGRKEAEAAARRNAEALEARLQQIESGLIAQREREVAAIQNSHRFSMVLVASIAGAGFVGMLVVALFLLRAMNRRAAMFAPPAFSETGLALAPLDPARQASARLRANLDRLEHRLQELETGAVEPAAESPPAVDVAGRVALLLGKGQALLNLQQAEAALACFDEAIALDPTYGEAFVKRGAAMERLGRLDEAIECYDRAIAVDTSLTMAYLCKGGVFNRQERYTEALQCYEQALRAQQKAGIP